MSNNNSNLKTNTTSLQELLTVVNNLPEASNGVELPTLTNEGTAADLLSGKELIDGDGNVVTGTIPTKTGSDLTSSGATVTVPAGYYAAQASKSVTTATQATPIISVNSAGKITATATQSAGYVSAGTKTGTKQLTVKSATTYTPGTSNQTIASGTYLTGTQTIKGDSNLKAENIKSGVTIFNVTGTSGGGADTSDATATADEIFAGETAYGASGKVTGTFTIDSELATQNSLIPQIRSALSRKALAPVTTLPSIGEKEVCFYDYDGTLLYSCSVEDAMSLTELPELPVHEGLICQGWNYDLATIKSYNRAMNVGATYITDDGKTRLYIRIAAEGRMDVPLYFSQTVSNGVTIDWGDGSATQTLSGTGNVNTTHTYASIGDYVISLNVSSGCTLSFGCNSSSYCVMGATANNGRVYCNMLQKVEIGSGVKSISTYAFYYCYSLSSITIPNSVKSISTWAFYYCRSLSSITIPDSVTTIGDNAFRECSSLSSITIPDSVKSIGNYAFLSCNSLFSITIPNSVKSIGESAFNACSSLSSITIPDSVTRIGESAFGGCYSLSSITIPNSVTTISSNAFNACSSLSSITIPDSVKSIGTRAFGDCYSLSSITIPNSVKSIGTYAFEYCYALSSITIPDSVKSIGTRAFGDCYGMAIYDFTSHTSVPTLAGTNAFTGIPSDCKIKVPAALYDEWKTATNWSTYASQIVAV